MRTLLVFASSAFLGLSLAALPATGFAQTAASPGETATTPDQALQTPAGKFIQVLGNKAIGVIADKSLTQDQHSQKYGDLLNGAFDIPAIGRFVLGRSWNTATAQQQQEYLKLFEAIVIKMYGDRLSFYSGESFQVKSVRAENDKDVVVSSIVAHPQGEAPTAVDWRVHNADGRLTVVDVSVEGVSQSLTQRQEYAAIIQRNNGNIEGLLDLMRQRLNQPSAAGAQQ